MGASGGSIPEKWAKINFFRVIFENRLTDNQLATILQPKIVEQRETDKKGAENMANTRLIEEYIRDSGFSPHTRG